MYSNETYSIIYGTGIWNARSARIASSWSVSDCASTDAGCARVRYTLPTAPAVGLSVGPVVGGVGAVVGNCVVGAADVGYAVPAGPHGGLGEHDSVSPSDGHSLPLLRGENRTVRVRCLKRPGPQPCQHVPRHESVLHEEETQSAQGDTWQSPAGWQFPGCSSSKKRFSSSQYWHSSPVKPGLHSQYPRRVQSLFLDARKSDVHRHGSNVHIVGDVPT